LIELSNYADVFGHHGCLKTLFVILIDWSASCTQDVHGRIIYGQPVRCSCCVDSYFLWWSSDF